MSHLQVLWTVSTKTLAVDRKEVNKRKRAKKGKKKMGRQKSQRISKKKKKNNFWLMRIRLSKTFLIWQKKQVENLDER